MLVHTQTHSTCGNAHKHKHRHAFTKELQRKSEKSRISIRTVLRICRWHQKSFAYISTATSKMNSWFSKSKLSLKSQSKSLFILHKCSWSGDLFGPFLLSVHNESWWSFDRNLNSAKSKVLGLTFKIYVRFSHYKSLKMSLTLFYIFWVVFLHHPKCVWQCSNSEKNQYFF